MPGITTSRHLFVGHPFFFIRIVRVWISLVRFVLPRWPFDRMIRIPLIILFHNYIYFIFLK
jgi:hypothetical protein